MDNLLKGQTSLWAELRLVARAESVLYLDDLLPRRVRLGPLTLNGAATGFRAFEPSFSPNLAEMIRIGMKKSDPIHKFGKSLIGRGSRNEILDPGFLTRIGTGV